MNDKLAAVSLPLGQQLISQGVLTEDQLRIALLEQMKSQQPIGRLLVSLGFISEAALRETLSQSLGKRSIDLSRAIVDPTALQLIPRETARKHRILPVAWDPDIPRLTVAVVDATDVVALDHVRSLLHDEDTAIDTILAGESEIVRAIDQYYGHDLSIDGILREIETGEIDFRSLQAASDEYSHPVVRLIDALLTDAVKREASDVHFEPESTFLRIRYRIDGLLRQVRSLHKSYWAAMAVRIKVMSGMNIAENRAPQDGRISLNISGRIVDFRVSAQPTIHGENIVLRVLDRQRGILPLDQLGLQPAQLDMLRLMISRPEGVILVTGPTGSGKTTTLYSLLAHLNNETVNIMTLEDPVEYPMPILRQTSVSDTVKLDFANGIRSMMRQDPDIILVGEIRDAETAEMAFRAAMTGHQVFSTLHTNSALGALPRLRDIGIRPDIMTGNIIGIIAQRLVRRLCPHCKVNYSARPADLRLLGLPPNAPPPTLFKAKGCERCNLQGYRGRLAIMELLRVDKALDECVAANAPMHELRQTAESRGYTPLAEDGLRRVLEGVTSLDEVARVIDLTDRM